MPNAQFIQNFSTGGVTIQKAINRTADSGIPPHDITLPAAKAVTAWVKTDANTAGCNLPSGHGYTDGNFDVYWTGGARYGVPGTISTDALTLDGGSGTDFPASANTTVVVCRQVAIDTLIKGDALGIIGISLEYADSNSTKIGRLDMLDSGPASIVALNLLANAPQVFDIEGGAVNVFSGNPIVAMKASHNDASNAANLKVIGIQDGTP